MFVPSEALTRLKRRPEKSHFMTFFLSGHEFTLYAL
jgi:hypothetical protein